MLRSTRPHGLPLPFTLPIALIVTITAALTQVIADALDECDELAWRLGRTLGDEVGLPVLMYGRRAGRSLVDTRRGTSFFASCKANAPREASVSLPLDFGHLVDSTDANAHSAASAAPGGGVAAPSPGDEPRYEAALLAPNGLPQRRGVTVIGSQPYVTNFNIQVDHASIEECRAAAAALRAELGVQVTRATLPRPSLLPSRLPGSTSLRPTLAQVMATHPHPHPHPRPGDGAAARLERHVRDWLQLAGAAAAQQPFARDGALDRRRQLAESLIDPSLVRDRPHSSAGAQWRGGTARPQLVRS